MKVKELINILQELDPDMTVVTKSSGVNNNNEDFTTLKSDQIKTLLGVSIGRGYCYDCSSWAYRHDNSTKVLSLSGTTPFQKRVVDENQN